MRLAQHIVRYDPHLLLAWIKHTMNGAWLNNENSECKSSAAEWLLTVLSHLTSTSQADKVTRAITKSNASIRFENLTCRGSWLENLACCGSWFENQVCRGSWFETGGVVSTDLKTGGVVGPNNKQREAQVWGYHRRKVLLNFYTDLSMSKKSQF